MFTLALALAGTATLLNLLEAFVFRKLAVPAPEQKNGTRTERRMGRRIRNGAKLPPTRAEERTDGDEGK